MLVTPLLFLFTAYQLLFIQSWQNPDLMNAASYVYAHLNSLKSTCESINKETCSLESEEIDVEDHGALLWTWKNYLSGSDRDLTPTLETIAHSGHIPSILALGKGKYDGHHNFEKNPLAAEYWFRFLISSYPQIKESFESAFFLGLIIEDIDKDESLSWIEWAARHGNNQALQWLSESGGSNAFLALINIKEDQGKKSAPYYKALYNVIFGKNPTKAKDIQQDIKNHKEINWDRSKRLLETPLEKHEPQVSPKISILEVIRKIDDAIKNYKLELNSESQKHLSQALIYFHREAESLEGYKDSDAHMLQDVILKDVESVLEDLNTSQSQESSNLDNNTLNNSSNIERLERTLELISLGYQSDAKCGSHNPIFKDRLTHALYRLYGQYLHESSNFFDSLLRVTDATKSPIILLILLPEILRGDLEKLDDLTQASDLLTAILGKNHKNEGGFKEVRQSVGILAALGDLSSEKPQVCSETLDENLPHSIMKLHGLLCSDNRDIMRTFFLHDKLLLKSVLDLNLKEVPYVIHEIIAHLGNWISTQSHWLKTGFYGQLRSLKMGLSQEGVSKVQLFLKDKNHNLQEALEKLDSVKSQEAGLKAQLLEQRSVAYSYDEAQEIKNTQLDKLIKEKSAIELSLSRSQENFSHYLSQMFSSLESISNTNIYRNSQSFSVTLPHDAKYLRENKDDDESLFASHNSIDLDKGDVLQIRVTGEWSPLCALRANGYSQAPKIGPEGFLQSESNVKSSTSGKGSRNTQSHYTNTQYQVSANFGVSYKNIAGVSFGASRTHGSTQSSEKYQYKEKSESNVLAINFQSGLRLLQTPYPSAPAGAYLAIVVSKEKENLGEVIDVQALQRASSLVATKKVKVFFTVNDCHNGESNGTLGITYDKFSDQDSKKSLIIEFIQESIPKLRLEGKKIIKEGENTASQFLTLRSDILAKLEKKLNTNLHSMPEFKSLIENWLNHEFDALERQQKLLSIIHQIAILEIERDGVSKRQSLIEESQKLNEAEATRIQKQAKHIDLKYKVSILLNYIKQYVLPIVDLYYNRNKVTEDCRKKISKLTCFIKPSYKHDYSNIGYDLMSLSESLENGLSLADLEDYRQTPYVFLRIPRPGHDSENKDTDESKYLNLLKNYASVDSGRAKVFWEHIFSSENRPPIAIHIQPSDLYFSNKQNVLYKNMVSPLILDMMLIFSHKEDWVHDSTINDIDLLMLPFSAGPNFLMALNDNPEVYTLEEGNRNFIMSVGFNKQNGLFTDVTKKIQSETRQGVNAGYGLSPFTQFHIRSSSGDALHFLKEELPIDSDGFPQSLTDAWLVFRVFVKNQNNDISWLEQRDGN